ncbi:hypothetical protein GCM10010435_64800 [Winogradskya consettensis]|uniref:Uncharacterized protein n=1 Tax=Winogradskya consettensis TaxID=113560 RepID=A0A919SJQ5_9ACTN|nr:hypothetical protein [Actinoplanes consettensis]GIM72218.1 hypothetical protein Aco04nite_29160 [Actinoplanes consettensis]
MDLTWADLAEPVVGGLAAILGVYLTEEALQALRGRVPGRWNHNRTFLLPRTKKPAEDQAN